jgi:hypothetical protein
MQIFLAALAIFAGVVGGFEDGRMKLSLPWPGLLEAAASQPVRPEGHD